VSTRILITGGTGFVGSRVAQHLAKSNDNKIIIGSRNGSYNPDWLPEAEVVKINWDNLNNLTKVCSDVDVILHLAAMNASQCAENPMLAKSVNVCNTSRLMEAAADAGVKRVLYFSTAHVYGARLAGNINESITPQCTHPYGKTHQQAEDVVLSAASDTLTSMVLRVSNSFGAPAHAAVDAWMLLMNDLCKQVITTKKMILRSSGLQNIDFVTLSDLVRVVDHLIFLPKDHIGEPIFNIGSGTSMKVIEMIDIIKTKCSEIYGFTPEVTLSAPSDGENHSDFCYEIDRLLATGINLDRNYSKEVASLLLFCDQNFGGRN
jgi:UDP-glucose 4-epimerase